MKELSDKSGNSGRLQSFRAQLKDKRIVFLGDLIHGEANIDSLRGVIVRYLVEEEGFNAIAFESGFYDLWLANNRFKNGEDVNTLLSESIYSVWLGASLQPVVNVLENNRQKIKLLGFDPKFSGSGLGDIDHALTTYLTKAGATVDPGVLTKWREIVENIDEWNVDDMDDNYFKEVQGEIKKYLGKVNLRFKTAVEFKFWKQELQNIDGFYRMLKKSGMAKLTGKTFKASDANARDSLMALNLKFYTSLYPDLKVICWGASGHFARSVTSIESAELLSFKPMGSYFGTETMVIGAMGNSGSYGWSGNIQPMPVLPANSVEQRLSSLTKVPVLADLSGFKSEMPLYSSVFLESDPVKADWAAVFDWILFVNTVIPKTQFSTGSNSGSRKNENARLEKNPFKKSLEKGEVVLLKNGIPIHGKVIDKDHKPIPYTTIHLKNSGIGAIADSEGAFFLRVPVRSDTLIFSNIAFTETKISLRGIKDLADLTVTLDERSHLLPEITVASEDNTAAQILNKAIDKIKTNYWNGPSSMMIARHSLFVDSVSDQQVSIDWIASGYRGAGYSSQEPHDLRVIKARKGIYDTARRQFAYSSYKTSIRDFMGFSLLDQVLYRANSFLNKQNHRYFTIAMTDNVFENGIKVYRVDFVCNKISPRTAVFVIRRASWYKGYVLINADDFGIMKIESEVVWDKSAFNSKKYHLDPSVKTFFFRTSAEYEKQNGFYTLVKTSKYNNFDDLGPQNFYFYDYKRERQTKMKSDFTAGPEKYDPAFWANFDSQSFLKK